MVSEGPPNDDKENRMSSKKRLTQEEIQEWANAMAGSEDDEPFFTYEDLEQIARGIPGSTPHDIADIAEAEVRLARYYINGEEPDKTVMINQIINGHTLLNIASRRTNKDSNDT